MSTRSTDSKSSVTMYILTLMGGLLIEILMPHGTYTSYRIRVDTNKISVF